MFWLRGREAGVNILGNRTVLLLLPRRNSGYVGLFKRTIFVQSAANEVGAIGEHRSRVPESDAFAPFRVTSPAVPSIALRGGGGIRMVLPIHESATQRRFSGWGELSHPARRPQFQTVVLVLVIRVSKANLGIGLVAVGLVVI
jgi:hypothetical protein